MAIANPKVTAPSTDGTYTGIEAWLNQRGVTFTYEADFGLYQIDKETSLRNQARIGAPLIEEVVERYTIAMSNGAQFPPIVLYQTGKAKYVVIDGNHRLAAAIRSETPLGAYLIDKPSQEQIAILTYEANTWNGEPTTLAERERQAIHLIELGTSAGQAAQIMGVRPARLDYLKSDQDATARLGQLGFEPADFGITTRRRLNTIHSDVVLDQAAKLVKEANLKFEQVDIMVPRINAQRNESQQLSVLTEMRRESDAIMRTTAGGSVANRKTRPMVRLNNIVTKVRSFDVASLPAEMDPITKDQLRVALLDATRRMALILEALS